MEILKIWKKEYLSLIHILASISEIRNSKLNRNGDMGADPADSFEAPLPVSYTHLISI